MVENDFDICRKNFCKQVYKRGSDIHSAFIGLRESGEITLENGAVCWSKWTYASEDLFTRIVVSFSKNLWDKISGIDDYVGSILNSEIFGDAFLTKSVEEAREYGVELNLDVNRNFLIGSAQALRVPFEMIKLKPYSESNYPKLLSFGFSPDEAITLYPMFKQNEDGAVYKLSTNYYNCNHYPFRLSDKNSMQKVPSKGEKLYRGYKFAWCAGSYSCEHWSEFGVKTEYFNAKAKA